MKIGDVVMFIDKGTYAKWFFGQIGIVEIFRIYSKGEPYCKVRWLSPVPYFGKMTTVSSFSADKFEAYNENR